MTTHSTVREWGDHHHARKRKSAFVSTVCVLSGVLVVTPLALVFIYLVIQGAASVNGDFFTQLPKPSGELGGGMANAIVGTFTLLAIASLIGVPIGIFGAVYLAEYGSPKLNWWIRFSSDILNGVPSIIWGIVIYGLMVVPMKGYSALAGGVALGCLMIPIILRTTEEVLLLVPQGYREAALALGIARWKVILQIVIKTASRGIITALLLAFARVAGETAPLLFTALGNNFWNRNLLQPISALPLQIYSFATSAFDDYHRQAWAGALVLVTFVFVLNISVRFLTREKA